MSRWEDLFNWCIKGVVDEVSFSRLVTWMIRVLDNTHIGPDFGCFLHLLQGPLAVVKTAVLAAPTSLLTIRALRIVLYFLIEDIPKEAVHLVLLFL